MLTRGQVYIKLTKGKSMAVYELRRQRRQRSQRSGLPGHMCSQHLGGSSNAEDSVVASMVPAVISETGSFQQPSTDVGTGYSLAALAPDFVLASVRSRPNEVCGK